MGIADVCLDSCYSSTGHNVIATIPGLYDTTTIYLAGGHYDSYAPSNAPSADDNASGTAAAMEYTRILSQSGNRPNNTVKFVAFDAEELGLYGSEYLADRMVNEGARIGCMLNFDMIGAENNDSVFLREYKARPFAGIAQTVFFDDFENGLAQWVRGHSSDTVDWDTTSLTYYSPYHSVTDSRIGNYANNVNSWIVMAQGLNLNGYTRASLSWW